MMKRKWKRAGAMVAAASLVFGSINIPSRQAEAEAVNGVQTESDTQTDTVSDVQTGNLFKNDSENDWILDTANKATLSYDNGTLTITEPSGGGETVNLYQNVTMPSDTSVTCTVTIKEISSTDNVWVNPYVNGGKWNEPNKKASSENAEFTYSPNVSGDTGWSIWMPADSQLELSGIYLGDSSGSGSEEDPAPDDEQCYETENITVKKVENITDDFIKGVDISSYVALKESGVKFYNTDGEEVSGSGFIKTFADAGVNYIRLRIWNDPKTEKGVTYGGGNNDINVAKEICSYIAKYNNENDAGKQDIKVLIDLQYSDFWADPDKQTAPKAWKDMDITQKVEAVKEFTTECIEEISSTDVEIGMIQVGNETNTGICGTKIPDVSNGSDQKPDFENSGLADTDYVKIFDAGCTAIDEYNAANGTQIKKVVHFTDPHSADTYFAKLLKAGGVNYDIYATSYYPYWHGTTANLHDMLQKIAKECDVDVMVAETQYIYDNRDYDGAENQAFEGKENTDLSGWPVSIQGQINEIRDVIDAVASVNSGTNKKGLGMFYWEPAWLPVSDVYVDGVVDDDKLAANKHIWETYGSGWATNAAGEYDKSAAEYGGGGSNVDCAALFDAKGHPLESLNVFKYVDHGAKAKTPSYYRYSPLSAVTVVAGTDADTIMEKLNNSVSSASYERNDGTTGEADITWQQESVEALAESISSNSSVGRTFYVKGFITVDGKQHDVLCDVMVEPLSLIKNGGFEQIENSVILDWDITSSDCLFPAWGDNNQHGGNNSLKFETKNEEGLQTSTASQVVTIDKAGVYELKAFVQGSYEGSEPSDEYVNLSAVIDKETYTSDRAELSGWKQWKEPVITNLKVTDEMIAEGKNQIIVNINVGIMKGTWGCVDDIYLYKIADISDSTDPSDPEDPSDPTDPSDPSDPTDPSKPIDPSKPTSAPKPTNTPDTGLATYPVQIQTSAPANPTPTSSVTTSPTPTGNAAASPLPTSGVKASPTPTGNTTVSPAPTDSATVSPAPEGDGTANPAPTGSGAASPAPKAEGTVIANDSTKGVFTVTNDGAVPEVSYKGKKNAAKVVIPATVTDKNGVKYKVTSIAKNAFKGNKNLKTVKIGKNIDTIGDKAFYNCEKLKKVVLPAKVTKIGKKAFSNCKNLKTIVIKTKNLTAKMVGKNAFKGIDKNAVIKVPSGKVKSYTKILHKKGVDNKVKIVKNK